MFLLHDLRVTIEAATEFFHKTEDKLSDAVLLRQHIDEQRRR